MKKSFLLISIFICLLTSLSAQTHISTDSHQEKVSVLCPLPSKSPLDYSFFSVSEDGSLIKWSGDSQGEHYQVSDLPIKLAATSPDGKFIAVYETDTNISKVSVWDIKTITKVFQKKYNDTITAINFSAKGNFLLVGQSSMEGVELINTKSWTVIPNKFSSNTSISNLLYTSDTEKTAVFYNSSGTLSYFNMQKGDLKTKFSIQPALNQTNLYNSAKLFCGANDNSVYIYNPFKGNLIKRITAYKPIILSNQNDIDLYYLDSDGGANYTIYKVKSLENNLVLEPEVVKTFKLPKNRVSCGLKNEQFFYFGTTNGNIYSTDFEATVLSEELNLISQSNYIKINDIAHNEDGFIFITNNAIYKTNYDEQTVQKIIDTQGQTNIINYLDNQIILWSKDTKKTVTLLNLTTGESKILFNPKNNIQSLKLFIVNKKYYLIEMERNTYVNIYDFSKSLYKEIYSGAGIQDAIITNDNNLYVAKSAATNPKSALVCVNLNTHETVGLPVNADVCFGLTSNGDKIFGVSLVVENNQNSTYIFNFDIKTKTLTPMLKFSEEDIEVFTYLYNDILYTNIGKMKFFCYNTKSKKKFNIDRSAFIPVNIIQNDDSILILNSNGSISWTEENNTTLKSTWYLTKEELIEVF